MEKKFATFEYEGTIVNTVAGASADPATALSLTAIAAGDGPTHRDGRHIKVLGVFLRGQVLFSALSPSVDIPLGDYVRIAIVLDTQTNGAQLSVPDVFSDVTDTDLDTMAFRNLEYTQRFKVLKDFVVRRPYMPVVAPTGTTYASSGTMVPWKVNLSFMKRPLQINYTNTSADISNCVDNSIHVIAMAVRNDNVLRYVARTRFVG